MVCVALLAYIIKTNQADMQKFLILTISLISFVSSFAQDTLPEQFWDRTFYERDVENPTVTRSEYVVSFKNMGEDTLCVRSKHVLLYPTYTVKQDTVMWEENYGFGPIRRKMYLISPYEARVVSMGMWGIEERGYAIEPRD